MNVTGGGGGGSLRITSPNAAEAAIGFYKNADQSGALAGDLWVAGLNSWQFPGFSIGTTGLNAVLSITNTGTVTIPYNFVVNGQTTFVNDLGPTQLQISNTSTNPDVCAELTLIRNNLNSSFVSALGMGGTLGRGAYWWVGGYDRINIRADINLIKFNSDLIVIGQIYRYVAGFTGVNSSRTLFASDLLKNIINNSSSTAITLTLPSGTEVQTNMIGASSSITINQGIEWSLINSGSGTVTLAAGSSHTILGSPIINTAASGRFYTKILSDLVALTFRLA